MNLRLKRMSLCVVALCGAILAPVSAVAETKAALEVLRGEVNFEPAADEEKVVPTPFQLGRATFAYEETVSPNFSDDVTMSWITFPSPVKTAHEANNTVHCEYYRPAKAGKYPACVVLHILGGDFPLARLCANSLAHRGVAAIFVKMPYYGPRRVPNVAARMISSDPNETVLGMTQAVKDIRYAAAFLASRAEVDPEQLGVFGISLGGITAALAGTAEPRFKKVCPVLAGGDMASVIWESPKLEESRRRWAGQGGTKQTLVELMKTVDPVTYADRMKGRKILMLNALHDEIIPKTCTENLWQAFGKPPIHWYNAGHISAAWHLLDAMNRVTAFFQPEVP